MGKQQVNDSGSQYKPYSEESELLTSGSTLPEKEMQKNGIKMPDYRKIKEMVRTKDYPWNLVNLFY